ncbi:enoyl-CoA hydratase/isomerase family protein [Streptomyces endophyticus]|uniref:Enoyl-CoA hydratase/isomerase family protein n=1 Tax=Streptomyces endophyticus TaxID=714166 RepID=A0ABU6FD13_9ACTN|nr:enoyl-CoA hydratase/isomerase family protein [Streptomyces endophyticus]MEB8341749.1 enoyl-CoA hydratase/isomerase family protein [Streptomyces endophyticus]
MTVRTEIDKATGVATVTLDRPRRHNALDQDTVAQLAATWRGFRFDDAVRAVVLTGAGDRAFCTGIDRGWDVPQPDSPYSADDPLPTVGPKANDLWKPVIAAVNGMACGGAFYLIGESEFVVADETATFFDPHTTYGMVNAFESIYLAHRMPPGEVARLALMGAAERMSARRAHEVGLVSELTPPGGALEAALRCATVIAGHPTEAVQGTVKALWAAKEATRSHAFARAPDLIKLGNLPPERQADLFNSRTQGGFRTR